MSPILSFLWEIIFPPYCAGCGRLNTFLCPTCYEEIHFFTMPLKLKLDPCYLDQVISVAEYQTPLSSLIKMYKYQGVKAIGQVLARLMYHTTNLPAVAGLTYVPLHSKRVTERGFNQSELIAKELSILMKVPSINLLTRVHHSATQASITDRSQRLGRLQNYFQPNDRLSSPLPASVLLIDDVTTTGTTLNECAKVLKEMGVKKVIGLTVAHEG